MAKDEEKPDDFTDYYGDLGPWTLSTPARGLAPLAPFLGEKGKESDYSEGDNCSFFVAERGKIWYDVGRISRDLSIERRRCSR